jgi:hypothetical protein
VKQDEKKASINDVNMMKGNFKFVKGFIFHHFFQAIDIIFLSNCIKNMLYLSNRTLAMIPIVIKTSFVSV